jgi:hypothetical protein
VGTVARSVGLGRPVGFRGVDGRVRGRSESGQEQLQQEVSRLVPFRDTSCKRRKISTEKVGQLKLIPQVLDPSRLFRKITSSVEFHADHPFPSPASISQPNSRHIHHLELIHTSASSPPQVHLSAVTRPVPILPRQVATTTHCAISCKLSPARPRQHLIAHSRPNMSHSTMRCDAMRCSTGGHP